MFTVASTFITLQMPGLGQPNGDRLARLEAWLQASIRSHLVLLYDRSTASGMLNHDDQHPLTELLGVSHAFGHYFRRPSGRRVTIIPRQGIDVRFEPEIRVGRDNFACLRLTMDGYELILVTGWFSSVTPIGIWQYSCVAKEMERRGVSQYLVSGRAGSITRLHSFSGFSPSDALYTEQWRLEPIPKRRFTAAPITFATTF